MNTRRFLKSNTALCSMPLYDTMRSFINGGGGNNNSQSPTNGNNPPANPPANAPTNGGPNTKTAGNPNTPNNTPNDGAPNDDLIQTIWDNAKKPDDGNPGGGPNPPPANNGNPPPDARAQVQAYLDGAGLGEFKLTDQEVEAFKTGENINDVLNRVNQRIQRAHMESLKGFNSILDERLPQMVTEAVTKANQAYVGDKAREALFDKLPWAKNPTWKPVAESIMKRFMDKGADTDKAVALTEEYFQKFAQDMTGLGPNLNTRGGNNPPVTPQSPGNRNWQSMLRDT